MMTSRAEYRLLLRQDNADLRLTPIGHEVGLISEKRYKKFLKKRENIKKEIERIKNTNIKPTNEINKILEAKGTSTINNGIKMSEILKRTEITYQDLETIDKERPKLTKAEQEQVEIQIKYEGYINLQETAIEKFKKLENKVIPADFEYKDLKGISLEAIQKLDKFKPVSVGQASRISGISPADISVLLIYLEQFKKTKK